jgi:four helix bundle suffix protein
MQSRSNIGGNGIETHQRGVRDHRTWEKNFAQARYLRTLASQHNQTYEAYREFVETRTAEIVANIAICLIHQANVLLDRYRKQLEIDFVKEGGIRERMTRARLEYRRDQRGRAG